MVNKFKLWIENKIFIGKILKYLYSNTAVKYRNYHQNKQFLKYGQEVLEQLDQAFVEIGIPYWLDFGTLLGAVRDYGFIEHDLDIDVGLFLNDRTEKIRDVLAQYGFTLYRQITIDEGKYGLEETYIYHGVSIDLFYYKKEGDIIITHGFTKKDGLSWEKTLAEYGGYLIREIYLPYSGLEKISFLGKQYPVPKDPHLYLKSFYGENYMIKNSNWDYQRADSVKLLNDKVGVVTLFNKHKIYKGKK